MYRIPAIVEQRPIGINVLACSPQQYVGGLGEGQAEVVLVASRVYAPARRIAEGQRQGVSFGAARLCDGHGVHRMRPIGALGERTPP